MHTVVSAMPFPIREVKPGLTPPVYSIPAAEDGEVRVLHVDRAMYPVYITDGKTLPQWTDSEELANSIVNDFVSAQLAYREDARPALFVLEGKVTEEEVKTKYAKELAAAIALQKSWFWHLVRLADDDWQKYRQHRMITDYQRFAAKDLNLQRDWLITIENLQDCPGCSTKVRIGIAVCPHCRCILDEVAASKLKFAKVG